MKHKVSTSKPSAAPLPNSTPIILHPASTTTPKTPVHPFVPTTTYKPNHHLTHFHSTTPPSIEEFLAINNAFSSASVNQKGEKSEDSSSQYDEDEEEEEGEEEEEDDNDHVTDHPEVIINRGMGHHFPVTTVNSQNRLVSPEQHNIPQLNVKVHGTGESGLILNQSNRPEQQKYPSTHMYKNQRPSVIHGANAHSKHQLNIHLILNQQRENEKKIQHGFKPIENPDNKNQFLFSSTTQRPAVPFTLKSPNIYSTTTNPPIIEPFSLHPKVPQIPTHTTQRPHSNSPFPPQTNAHQVPPNPQLQQIHSNIANSGGLHTHTIRISQNPLTFQFTSNDNKYQAHQLFTTPSVAVIATTSSTSSSSSVRNGPSGRVGNTSPVISSLTGIGNSPKGSSVPNSSSGSVQPFAETTPPSSYDEYQDGDVLLDPFFRDVPKIPKPSPARHGIVRRKREAIKTMAEDIFVPPRNVRYKLKAAEQIELPTEVYGNGEGNWPGIRSKISDEKLSHQSNSRGRIRVEPQSKRTSTPESKQSVRRLRPSPFVSVTHEVSTEAEVLQQSPQYSSIPLPTPAPKNPGSKILDSPVRNENHQGHQGSVKARRRHKQNLASATESHIPSEIIMLPDYTDILQQFTSNPILHVKSPEATTVPVWLIASTSRPIESSYEISAASIGINEDNPQPSQHFTESIAIGRTRGRGGNRQRHHQPSQSNLNENNSGRSRQRGRQMTMLENADNAYGTRAYLSGSSLTSHQRENITSRRDVHRNSDFENVHERVLYNSNTEATANIRSHRRKLGVSSVSQNMTTAENNEMKLPANKTGNIRESETELPNLSPTSLPETNFTCADKIPGGYYADLEADCQLFHICSIGRHGK
jgi:hypothetical protein